AGFAHDVTECRILQPRHELRHHAPSIRSLFAVGINVICVALPDHALCLDLKLLGIKVSMALYGDLSSNRNDAFLEAGGLGGRRQSDVPELPIGAYFHCGVRPGETYAAFYSSGKLKFFVGVSTPSMMGKNRIE